MSWLVTPPPSRPSTADVALAVSMSSKETVLTPSTAFNHHSKEHLHVHRIAKTLCQSLLQLHLRRKYHLQPKFHLIHTESCGSLIVDKSSWSGNVGAKLKIKIVKDISSFSIIFKTDVPLKSITFWEGDVSPTTGSSFTLTNKNWFGGKKVGEFLELGFQMSFS